MNAEGKPYSTFGVWILLAAYFFRLHEQFPLLKRLDIVTISVAILAILVALDASRGIRPNLGWPILGWLLALTVWAFAGVPFALDQEFALRTCLELAKSLLIFVLARTAMEGRRPLQQGVVAICACATVLALIGVGQYLGWPSTPRRWPRIVVLSGAYSDPNMLAALLVACLPFALAASLTGTTRRARTAGAAAGLILIAGLTACQSKGGYLALLLVGVLFLVRYRWAGVAWCGAGAILMIALPYLAERIVGKPPIFRPVHHVEGRRVVDRNDPGVRHRIFHLFDRKEISVGGRWAIWRIGLQMALANPVTGVGAGCYSRAYEPIAAERSYPPDLRKRSSHSSYVRLAAELGFPGLLLFVALLSSAMLRLWRPLPRSAPGFAAALSLTTLGLTLATIDQLGGWGFFVLLAVADAAAAARARLNGADVPNGGDGESLSPGANDAPWSAALGGSSFASRRPPGAPGDPLLRIHLQTGDAP